MSCNVKNETEFKIVVREHILLVKQLLEKNFQKLGIKCNKIVISNESARTKSQIFSIKLRALWAIVKEVLVRSDDLLAEAVVKNR